VLAKLTYMTQGPWVLITRDDRHVLERGEGGRTEVTKAVMPQGG